MAKTKRPKTVAVSSREVISHSESYTCPSCHTVFCGYGPAQNVTRFICSCGQELIVGERETTKKSRCPKFDTVEDYEKAMGIRVTDAFKTGFEVARMELLRK